MSGGKKRYSCLSVGDFEFPSEFFYVLFQHSLFSLSSSANASPEQKRAKNLNGSRNPHVKKWTRTVFMNFFLLKKADEFCLCIFSLKKMLILLKNHFR